MFINNKKWKDNKYIYLIWSLLVIREQQQIVNQLQEIHILQRKISSDFVIIIIPKAVIQSAAGRLFHIRPNLPILPPQISFEEKLSDRWEVIVHSGYILDYD